MGLINKMFGGNKKNNLEDKVKYINWLPLTSLNQLKEIKEESKTQTVLIFKHSTRCGISRMVIKQFENLFNKNTKDLKVYYLDLLSYRDISDEVGYAFQVMHQSPQLLVIKNEVSVFNTSHYDITLTDLTRFI